MRGYIATSLKGDVTGYLKDKGIRMQTIEKEINSIAMDMIGDIIVEDGNPIEDYMDDMRERI